MKLRTDFIVACVEGKTADGREITAQQIDQMAQSYAPSVYLAHIWLEHLRGTMPDGVFKSLGDVVAVKVETLGQNAGILAGKKALKVQLEPHPDLVKMVRDGQKLHLSVELLERLPATGGAYLIGLGVTDTPASLGTGVMQFNSLQRKESLFSEPLACDLALPTVAKAETTRDLAVFALSEAVETLRSSNETLKKQVAEKDAEIASLKDRIPAPAGYFNRSHAEPKTPTPTQNGAWL